MKSEAKIREYIRAIAGTDQYEIHQGFISEVRADSVDVEVDDGVIVHDVRINVLPGADFGIRPVPEMGSACIIARIEKGQNYQLMHCEKLESYSIRVGSLLFQIDKEKIFFNEGKQGGMVLLNPLIAELKKIDANITILKTATSALAQAVNAIAPGTGPAFTLATAAMQPLITSTLENIKVKQ
jgi:hypothetical protein